MADQANNERNITRPYNYSPLLVGRRGFDVSAQTFWLWTELHVRASLNAEEMPSYLDGAGAEAGEALATAGREP